MGAISDKEGLFEFREFKGLRNNIDERDFGPGDLTVALNMDVDNSLEAVSRRGFSAPVVAGVDRCLFAHGSICVGVGTNALKRILPDYTTAVLHTGLAPSVPVSYAPVADRVYYSNGAQNGVITPTGRRSWGLEVPPRPVLSATAGALQAGRYQVAITYLRDDGQESGAGLASVFELVEDSGLHVSSIPVSSDTTVTYKAVYITAANGETLFRAGVVENSATTFTVREVSHTAAPLTTQFLAPPPAGDLVTSNGAYMLVARGSLLYPSEYYAPELFDLRKAIPFSARITMLVAVENEGVWVGTDSEVLWLAGKAPDVWEYQARADYGVIPGSVAISDGSMLPEKELEGEHVVFFAATRGLCAGVGAGQFRNLTEENYAIPATPYGASIARRHRGLNQLLVSLQGTAQAANEYT